MAYYCDVYGNCYNDSWYVWGRWVLLGAIVLFCLFICIMIRCINRRRIKRGGGPVRYTGWTVPTYNQSQQQYGYATDNYNMNNYSQQPQAPYSSGNQAYQGQPTYTGYGNNAAQSGPAYYDATQTQEQGHYQPPAYPPPVGKPPV